MGQVASVEVRERQDGEDVGRAELVIDDRSVAEPCAGPEIAFEQRRQRGQGGTALDPGRREALDGRGSGRQGRSLPFGRGRRMMVQEAQADRQRPPDRCPRNWRSRSARRPGAAAHRPRCRATGARWFAWTGSPAGRRTGRVRGTICRRAGPAAARCRTRGPCRSRNSAARPAGAAAGRCRQLWASGARCGGSRRMGRPRSSGRKPGRRRRCRAGETPRGGREPRRPPRRRPCSGPVGRGARPWAVWRADVEVADPAERVGRIERVRPRGARPGRRSGRRSRPRDLARAELS